MVRASTLKLNSSLSLLRLNPKEMEAFREMKVVSIEDFIRCDLDQISHYPGIGKKKLLKLKQIQTEKKKLLFPPTDETSDDTSILDEYLWAFDWTTREFNALKEADLKTVRDFLQYEIRIFKDRKRIGRKTYQGLFDKQKKMFEEYGRLLMKEWSDQERPLMMFTEFSKEEQNFLSSLGFTSIQEFIFVDLRLLALNESNRLYIEALIPKQEKFRRLLSTEPLFPPGSARKLDKESAAADSDVIYPIGLSLYEQWEKPLSDQSLRSLPLFANHFNKGFFREHFHESYCPDYQLSHLVLPRRIGNILKKVGIEHLGEFLLIPFSFFDKIAYCSRTALDSARTVIEEFLVDNKHKRYEADFSTPEAFAYSLVQYVSGSLKRKDRWTLIHLSDDRRHRIIEMRAAGKTLDEVGTEFGITRERIRQIEHNIWRQVASFQGRLQQIESLIADALSSLGGFVKDRVLYRKLADRTGWNLTYIKYFTEHFLDIFTERFKRNEVSYISFATYRCDNCPVFYKNLDHLLFQLEKDRDILSIDKVATRIRGELAACEDCKACPEKNRSFPGPMFSWLFEIQPKYREYRRNKTVRMNSRLGLYESILMALKLAGRPLSKREILLEVQKICPKLRITEKQIKTTAGNSLQHTREILLWNRGGMNSESMYVYKDFVKTDLPILDTIENDLLARAKKTRIPQMRLNRIFSLYADECREQGIPNVYALFAALKCRENPNLTFQRSPYIGFTGKKQKISNAGILEDFVRQRGGTVSSTALKAFGRSLGLRDEHIQNTIALTHLLATKKGYVLYDELNRNSNEYSRVVSSVRDALTNAEHLTVMEIFQLNPENYESMRIADAKMLYHWLKRFADDIFNLEYPVVSLQKHHYRRSLRNRVSNRIRHYLADKRVPVGTKRIFDLFANKLGYPQAAIYNVLSSRDILIYGNNLYTHDSVIRWNREKQQIISKLLEQYRNELQSKPVIFGSAEEFLLKYRQELPKIRNRMQWNRYLVASLLAREEGVIFLGNNRNIFSFQSEPKSPKTFGEYVQFQLLAEFQGNADLKEFARFLSTKLHAIKRELTPFMLDNYPGVTFNEGRIFVTPAPEN